jgi:iron complex transport system substrate-binding protein
VFVTGDLFEGRALFSDDLVATYISPFGCPKGTPSAEATWENVWKEMREVGTLPHYRGPIAVFVTGDLFEGRALFSDDLVGGIFLPFIGAGHGGPQLLMDAVGAKNLFANLDGGWADGSWEKIVSG